jgi:carbonic anhydrase
MKRSPCSARLAALFLLVIPILLIGTSSRSLAQPQSPLDLRNGQVPVVFGAADIPDFTAYPVAAAGLKAKNEGSPNREKQIKITGFTAAHKLVLGGVDFPIQDVHFHTHSEHCRHGQPYAMEMHIVHKSQAGVNLAVGIWLTLHPNNVDNPILKPLFDNLPANAQAPDYPMPDFNLAGLLPPIGQRKMWQYDGSLTTPHEFSNVNVRWIVMDTPITISLDQLNKFRALWPEAGNFRKVQELTGAHNLRTDVPEPGTLAGVVLIGLFAMRRTRRHGASA